MSKHLESHRNNCHDLDETCVNNRRLTLKTYSASFFLIALQKPNPVHISASSKQRLLLEVEYPSRKDKLPITR